ncbi:MAG: hypothetical protein M5U19_18445 [Microthrixaceae bacterium]|nr:hypothetical protein [Microthrixaceae bacterium]
MTDVIVDDTTGVGAIGDTSGATAHRMAALLRARASRPGVTQR